MAMARRIRRLLTVAISLALLAVGTYAAALWIGRTAAPLVEKCTAPFEGVEQSLDTEQAGNAALITGVAVSRSLPPRAATIALATAMQESTLRNIDYGDHAGPDSRGLFQQRPSQGWGTETEVMDPVYASNAFYDVLITVEGYQDLPITTAAQTVQRSAFPQAYAQHEELGRAFASALTGNSSAALDCRLRAPETAGHPDSVLAELVAIFGPSEGDVKGRTLSVPARDAKGWAVAQWAVANAKGLSITRVDHAGHSWLRDAQPGWSESPAAEDAVVITVAGED